MAAYWFFFALPAIAALSPIYVKKDIDIFFWSLLFLTYVFVIGFRHQVGGDWGTYIITSGVFSKRFNFFPNSLSKLFSIIVKNVIISTESNSDFLPFSKILFAMEGTKDVMTISKNVDSLDFILSLS